MNQAIDASKRADELRGSGLALIDFPSSIAKRVENEILAYFIDSAHLRFAGKQLVEVTREIATIPDKAYEALMPISRRIISRALGYEIEAFVQQSLGTVFGPCKLGINLIPAADRHANPDLLEDQLAIYWRC